MQTYFATLEANVELGTVPETKQLTFDLMAEGTLPHVVGRQADRAHRGGRADDPLPAPARRAHRAQQLTLATRACCPRPSPSRSLGALALLVRALCGQSISLPSMGEQTVDVVFRPLAEGETSRASTSRSTRTTSRTSRLPSRWGTCRRSPSRTCRRRPIGPARSTGRPRTRGRRGGDEDKLTFGDVEVGVPKALTFTLRNFSATARAASSGRAGRRHLLPRVGHLVPQRVKSITATFSSAEPLEYDAEASQASALTKISYAAGGKAPPEWDDSMTVVKLPDRGGVPARGAVGGAAAAGGRGGGEGAPGRGRGRAGRPLASAPEIARVAERSPSRARRKVVDTSRSRRTRRSSSPRARRARRRCRSASRRASASTRGRVRGDVARLQADDDVPGALALVPAHQHVRRRAALSVAVTAPTARASRCRLARGALRRLARGGGSSRPTARSTFPSPSRRPEVETYRASCSSCAPTWHDDAAAPVVTSRQVDAPVLPLRDRPSRTTCARAPLARHARPRRLARPARPGDQGHRVLLARHARAQHAALLRRQPDQQDVRVLLGAGRRGGSARRRRRSSRSPSAARRARAPCSPGASSRWSSTSRRRRSRCRSRTGASRCPSSRSTCRSCSSARSSSPASRSTARGTTSARCSSGSARARRSTSSTPSTCPSPSPSRSRPSRAGRRRAASRSSTSSRREGVVGPDSSLPIELTFTPSLEKHFNFNIELRVRNKPQPLVLNVKGEGYAIHDTLHLSDAGGKLVEISPYAPTRVDFGLVHINDKIIRQLQITNSGRFNFDVALTLKVPPGVRMPPVAVTPELATVKRNERVRASSPTRPRRTRRCRRASRCRCRSPTAARTRCSSTAAASKPRLSFSFTKHDFGPCFVVTPKNGMRRSRRRSRLANEDENEIYFDAAFDEVDFLTATVNQTTIAPGETPSRSASVRAARRGQVRDAAALPHQRAVHADRDGARRGLRPAPRARRPRAAAAQPRQRAAQPAGHALGRPRQPLAPPGRRLARRRRREAAREVDPPRLLGRRRRGDAAPARDAPLELRFVPTARIPPFSEPVVAQVCGLPRAMLQLSGACVSRWTCSSRWTPISFGQATLHSRITRPLMLQNKGDIPSTWRLDKALLQPDFSVSPLEGYLQPNEDTNIEITFHPRAVNRDIRYERIPVYVDGQSPLALTLTGMCVEATAEEAPLAFKTQRARAGDAEDRDQEPVAAAVVDQARRAGRAVVGAEVLEVPAGGSAEYEVTYCPMMMTKEEREAPSTRLGLLPAARRHGHPLQARGRGRAARRRGHDRQVARVQAAPGRRARRRQLAQAAAALPRRHPSGGGHRPVDEAHGPRARRRARQPVARESGSPSSRTRRRRRTPRCTSSTTRTASTSSTSSRSRRRRRGRARHDRDAGAAAPAHVARAAARQPARRARHLHRRRQQRRGHRRAVARPCRPTARPSCPSSGGRCCRRRRPRSSRSPRPSSATSNYDLRLQALPAGETKSMQFKCALGDAADAALPLPQLPAQAGDVQARARRQGRRAPGDFECDATVSAPAAEGSDGAEVAGRRHLRAVER